MVNYISGHQIERIQASPGALAPLSRPSLGLEHYSVIPIGTMANIRRSAKPCNDWTIVDLDSYHISLNQLDLLSFFGLQVGRDNSLQPLERPYLASFYIAGVTTALG